MTATAHFAAHRAELILVERPANPVFANGREVGVEPGKYHYFHDHRCKIEGQKSIDFVRERMKAANSPGLWEIDADDVPDTMQLLAELALAPIERVREILAAEQDGPAREAIIAVAHEILNRAGVSDLKPGAQPKRTRHETVTA